MHADARVDAHPLARTTPGFITAGRKDVGAPQHWDTGAVCRNAAVIGTVISTTVVVAMVTMLQPDVPSPRLRMQYVIIQNQRPSVWCYCHR